MPKHSMHATTPSEDAELAGAEQWLDQLDPADVQARDASHVRALMAAQEDLDAAVARLRQRVAEARAGGDSWTVIGAALGVSKQAAHERYRDVDQAPRP